MAGLQGHTPPGIHALCGILSPECGLDLVTGISWIAPGKSGRMPFPWLDFKISWLPSCKLSLGHFAFSLALWSMMPVGRRSMERPGWQQAEGGLRSTCEELKLCSNRLEETESCQQPGDGGRKWIFPSSLEIIAVMWETQCQRTQLSQAWICSSQKLRDRLLLF